MPVVKIGAFLELGQNCTLLNALYKSLLKEECLNYGIA
jgi:hypothetical protein